MPSRLETYLQNVALSTSPGESANTVEMRQHLLATVAANRKPGLTDFIVAKKALDQINIPPDVRVSILETWRRQDRKFIWTRLAYWAVGILSGSTIAAFGGKYGIIDTGVSMAAFEVLCGIPALRPYALANWKERPPQNPNVKVVIKPMTRWRTFTSRIPVPVKLALFTLMCGAVGVVFDWTFDFIPPHRALSFEAAYRAMAVSGIGWLNYFVYLGVLWSERRRVLTRIRAIKPNHSSATDQSA